MWRVRLGDPCTVDEEDCALSPNYPQNYGNGEKCRLDVLGDPETRPAIRVESFNTEDGYDMLTVNGMVFDGTTGPEGLVPSGSIDWVSDGSVTKGGWKLCPAKVPPPTVLPTPAPTAAPEAWRVILGPCTVESDGCARSPNYPGNYDNDEGCVIEVLNPSAFPIQVSNFDTEYGYDILTVNGRKYSGATSPSGEMPTGYITWDSDGSVTRPGWKLCPSGR